MAGLRFGWYGDDFTGATDTLAVLAQAGLRAMLFLGVPGPQDLADAGPLDAVGMAGAARAMAPEAMRIELNRAGRFFESLAAQVLHYKVCSTFDSSAQIGNIACAIQTLRPFVSHSWVPIVGGQPSLGRYCAFSNLFAAAGTGGAVHRLDRHPTMRRHPVTPMGEADLRRHLAQQGLEGLVALHYPSYEAEPQELDANLTALLDSALDSTLVPLLLDLTHANQLSTLGRLIWQQARQQRLLAVGSSAVAQALVAHWAQTQEFESMGAAAPAPATAKHNAGPVFVLAGSLSPLTARQVQAANGYVHLAIDAPRLVDDNLYKEMLLKTITGHLRCDHHVLAYTAGTTGSVQAAVDPDSGAHIARACAELVAGVVQTQAVQKKPLRRMGIAGGDTSSHVAQALGLWGLSYGGTLSPGVTISRAHSRDAARDGMELILKGGQMGADDLFQRLLGQVAA